MSGTIFHPFVLDNAAGQETVVGIGSDSVKYGVGISSDTHVTGIQTVTGFLHAGGGIKDSSGNLGTSGKVLSSTGSGLAWIDPSEGSTTNAINVGTNSDSTNADQFVAFMGTSSGNNPVRVDAGLKYNPSTNILKAGNVELPNLGEFSLGNNQQLKMFHKNDTSDIRVEVSSNTNYILLTKTFDLKDAAGSKAAITATNPGGVPEVLLYHDGNERLKTTNDGVTITGDLTVTDIIANGNIDLGSDSNDTITMSGLVDSDIVPTGTTRDVGSNANRWRNLYATVIRDKDNQTGTSGQVLSSTGTELDWINIGDVAAGSAAQVAVSDESGDQTCFPLFVTDTTGNQSPKSGSNLTFNSSTGQLNATKFVGDGSGLTNISTLNQSTTGNAATATKLETARTISGASFDGTANVTLNNANITNGAGYVTSAGAVPSGVIVLWSGATNAIPTGWVLCNGQNSTPDLRDRFIIGAGNNYNVNATGGESSKLLGTANLPSHTHTDGTLATNNISLTGDIQKISECYNVAGSASGVFTKKGTGNSPVTGSSSNSPTAGVDFDASHSHDVTGNTGDQGGTMGQAFSILPPYYALAYIMKS